MKPGRLFVCVLGTNISLSYSGMWIFVELPAFKAESNENRSDSDMSSSLFVSKVTLGWSV